MNKLSKKYFILSNLSNNIFIQSIFSYVLAKLIIEVNLISNMHIDDSGILPLLSRHFGYILGSLLIILFNDWEKKTYRSKLYSEEYKKDLNPNNKRYFLQLLILLITISICFYIISTITFSLIVESKSINNLFSYNLITLLSNISQNYISLVFLAILLLFNKFIDIINTLSSVCFFLILGSLWKKEIILDSTIDNINLISINYTSLIYLITLISIFLLVKLACRLLKHHIELTNLSDFRSRRLSTYERVDLLNILKIYPIFIFFVFGLTN